jgi:prepilin-type processing-associated H-X9-DG protein
MPEVSGDWEKLLGEVDGITDKTELFAMYQALREVIAEKLGDIALGGINVLMPDGSVRPFKNAEEARQCLKQMNLK